MIVVALANQRNAGSVTFAAPFTVIDCVGPTTWAVPEISASPKMSWLPEIVMGPWATTVAPLAIVKFEPNSSRDVSAT